MNEELMYLSKFRKNRSFPKIKINTLKNINVLETPAYFFIDFPNLETCAKAILNEYSLEILEKVTHFLEICFQIKYSIEDVKKSIKNAKFLHLE